MTKILIQVLLLDYSLLLLDSRLNLSPKTRSTRVGLVVGSRQRRRVLNRREDRSNSRWKELLHRSSKGGCYSWLGLREVGGTRLLCRGQAPGEEQGPLESGKRGKGQRLGPAETNS